VKLCENARRAASRKEIATMVNRLGFAVVLALTVPASGLATPPAESGRTFQTGGVTLYYEPLGASAGTPLLVVNGGPGFDHSYLHVSNVWNELAKTRSVVLYDQRGTGKSTAGDKPGNLADQIDDLDALRQHLGVEKVDLLGHSWGGYLVMAYTARHPDRVRRLLIVDSAAPRWSDTVTLFKDIFPERVEHEDSLAFAAALGDAGPKADRMQDYFSMLFYDPEHRDAFLAAAGSAKYSAGVNQALNSDLERFDLGPELIKFHVPAVVIAGRFDANVAPATAYRIHKAIAGSRFVIFEKSGHLPFFEEPAKFLQVVEEFLGGQP
jgi:proline iminopeptidase